MIKKEDRWFVVALIVVFIVLGFIIGTNSEQSKLRREQSQQIQSTIESLTFNNGVTITNITLYDPLAKKDCNIDLKGNKTILNAMFTEQGNQYFIVARYDKVVLITNSSKVYVGDCYDT